MTKSEQRLAKRIGRRLALRRGTHNMTPEVFCVDLEISAASLRMYEKGRSIPGGWAVIQLAQAFGETADWVLCRKVAA